VLAIGVVRDGEFGSRFFRSEPKLKPSAKCRARPKWTFLRALW